MHAIPRLAEIFTSWSQLSCLARKLIPGSNECSDTSSEKYRDIISAKVNPFAKSLVGFLTENVRSSSWIHLRTSLGADITTNEMI